MSTKTKTRKIGTGPVLAVLTVIDLAERVALALDACGCRKALAERAARLVVSSVLDWKDGKGEAAVTSIDRLIAEAKTVRQAETAKRRPAVQAVPRRAQLAVEATPRRAGMKPAKASAKALGTKPFSRAASNRVEGTSFRVWGAGKVEAVVSAETAFEAMLVMQGRNPDLQIGAIHVDRVEKKGGAK